MSAMATTPALAPTSAPRTRSGPRHAPVTRARRSQLSCRRVPPRHRHRLRPHPLQHFPSGPGSWRMCTVVAPRPTTTPRPTWRSSRLLRRWATYRFVRLAQRASAGRSCTSTRAMHGVASILARRGSLLAKSLRARRRWRWRGRRALPPRCAPTEFTCRRVIGGALVEARVRSRATGVLSSAVVRRGLSARARRNRRLRRRPACADRWSIGGYATRSVGSTLALRGSPSRRLPSARRRWGWRGRRGTLA